MTPALARLSIAGGRPFIALTTGGHAQALAGWSGAANLRGIHSMQTLLDHWPHNAGIIATARLDPQRCVALECFNVHPPLQPRQVYCTIGNYRTQLLQAALDADANLSRAEALAAIERRCTGEPYACLKPGSAVTGPFGELPLSPDAATLDWEVELGVVIGRAAHHVRTAGAMSHVAGYCTVNDITLRQRLFRAEPKGMGTDFLQAKGGPEWLPVGPWFVPAHALPDPTTLRMTLVLNGQVMQDGNTTDMLFGIAEQIAYLSRHVRLEPGDLVCTGSPAGFGSHYGRFLQPGDIIEAEVSGLGRQRIHVIQENREEILP